MHFQKKDTYTMDDLLKIMEILRSPEGCPWDREQTHKSIRNNFLEEAYEAVEAIDTDDAELLQEELGDVLLQVVFHSRMEEETGGFGFADVVDGIAKKLIVRHPHVFGEITVKDSAEVLVNWEEIKRRTKGRETDTQVLKGVSAALPALMRAQKVSGKAAKAAGESPNLSAVLLRVQEAASRLTDAAASGRKEEQMEKLGELLFSAAEAAGLMHVEAEQALAEACGRFISGFEEREQRAAGREFLKNSDA